VTLRHVPELDGVRGIAILLVLAFHTSGLERWAAFGWCGVDLFFVLSGFLLTGVLLDGAAARRRARTFYVRRALRILPLYYVAIGAALVVVPLIAPSLAGEARRLAAHQGWLWTYTANWPIGMQGTDPVAPLPFVVHFWSLAIEEQFYLAWPLVIWYASRRQAVIIAWIAIVGALVCRAALLAIGAPGSMRYFLTPCRLDGLGVGSLIALWLRQPGNDATCARHVRDRMRAIAIAAGLVLLVIVIHDRGLPMQSDLVSTIGYAALAWVFGWLVTVAAVRPMPVLRTPALVTAGRYSYGLYVVHPLVSTVAEARWPALEHRVLGGVVMWVGSAILAVASYHGFEQRFLALKDRLAPAER
jgi:peptidoglycan/LPS O-acetylase OafA/YrhL